MKKLIFQLSEFEYLKVITKNNIDFEKIDFCWDEIEIYFIGQQKLLIGQQAVGEFFESFIGNLKKVINNKLQLHESITQNLGVMWNEKFQGKLGFIMIKASDGKSMYWVGLDYEMWAVFNNINQYVTTWLYNDKDTNIIFEVTPFYKWSVQEREPEDLDFVTYEEFMKDYQRIIQRVIPREIAIAWLDQAMKAYRSLFDNEEDFLSACKEFKL